VRHVGDRQQRLVRELEKLALGLEADASAEPLDADAVERLTASSAERRAWTVADAIVAGDMRTAVTAYLQLRQQGERLPGLIYWISQRVRSAHDVAAALDAGGAPAQVKRRLRMPSRAADRLIADARRTGSDRLAEAVGEIADLELASRGGGMSGGRVRGEDTAALIAIGRLTG
jgi:DNA polymerase III subunit delta